jgi:hypothetical protein
MTRLVLTVALLVVGLSAAHAQSWGRGGAYTGASPRLGYYGGRGNGNVTPSYREPCWSAATSKCSWEVHRAAYLRKRAAFLQQRAAVLEKRAAANGVKQ